MPPTCQNTRVPSEFWYSTFKFRIQVIFRWSVLHHWCNQFLNLFNVQFVLFLVEREEREKLEKASKSQVKLCFGTRNYLYECPLCISCSNVRSFELSFLTDSVKVIGGSGSFLNVMLVWKYLVLLNGHILQNTSHGQKAFELWRSAVG